ncbi:TolC family protein [Porphyromonas pogonae]|uniref:TolC family protein n=1 Tax=Porphyromonas pogonae TaxID=867595 RepID=UPI002E761A1F|nr:TolC family protein [Porphyromonas pogonae]
MNRILKKELIRIVRVFSVLSISSICCSMQLAANTQKKDSTLVLSLDDAVRVALSENPKIKVADLEIVKKNYDHKKTWSKFLPQIDWNTNYSYTIKKQKMYFDGMPGMPTKGEPVAFEVGQTHNIQTGVQAGIPIIAPQLWSTLAVTEKDIELSKEKSRGSKIDLVAEVKKAYYSILLAKDSYEVFKRSHDNATLNYNQIKEKFDRGLVAEFDLLRSDVQRRNIEPNMVQAEQSVDLAKARLKVLLDLDQNYNIIIKDSLTHYKDDLISKSLAPVDTILTNNSALRQLSIQQGQLKDNLKISKLAYLPTLSLGFLYNYNYMSNKFNLDDSKRWTPYSMLNLTLKIPLFSGGDRYYSVKANKISLQQMEMSRHDAEQQTRLGILNGRTQLKNAVQRYIAAEQAVRMAKKGYQIAQVRYKTGESTLVELNDADLALLQAELNYNQAIYDFMVARAEMDKLSGVEPIYTYKNNSQINNSLR